MEKNNNSINNYIPLDVSKYNISIVKDEEVTPYLKEQFFKLIIIGDIGTGKSSIINSLVKGKFKENYQATIGFDIFKYTRKVNDIIININIWDTCGLIDFSSCTTNLFKDAIIAIIVYEIDKRKSFENIKNWVNLFKLNSQPDTIIFIVGNKSDLEDKREVKKEEGIEYTKLNNFNCFMETTAKDDTIVNELFQQALARLYEYYKIYDKNEDDDDEEIKENFRKKRDTIILQKHNHNNKKKINKNCSC